MLHGTVSWLRVKLNDQRKGRFAQRPYSIGVSSDLKLALQANTLLADHIFSPSLLLAERIERGLLTVSGKNSETFCLIISLGIS